MLGCIREKEDKMQPGSCASPKYDSAASVGDKNTKILPKRVIRITL